MSRRKEQSELEFVVEVHRKIESIAKMGTVNVTQEKIIADLKKSLVKRMVKSL